MLDETTGNNEAEQKKKSSVLRVIGKIFKWLALAVWALLIIAALFFQAPWKVTALLVIILLACTILPKPYRKWFWASVGVVIVVLIIWVFLPDDTEGWRPYTFDEDIAALEAKYAVPDEENAAIIYNQLLGDYNRDDFEPNLPDPNIYYSLTVTEPWSNKDHPEMAEWIEQQESTIKTLIKASRLSKCRFPISANMFELKSMEQPGAMRYWAKLLIRAANNDLGEHRIDQALEKHIAVMQMGKHISQQPEMVDKLVGFAIEALALKQFNRFVVTGKPIGEHLSVIEYSLAEIKHDWSSDLTGFLEYDKLIMKSLLGSFYAINPKGQIRLNRNFMSNMITEEKMEEMGITGRELYWCKKFMKAYTILNWFYMPSTPQKVGAIVDDSFEKYYTTSDPNDWREQAPSPSIKSWFEFKLNYQKLVENMVPLMGGSYYKIKDWNTRVLADKRSTQLLIALRRYKNQHGHWPESLDDVKNFAPAEIFIDPFNGGSFVYKLTEDNFTIYSKGKNNIDENGEYNTEWNEETFESKVLEDDILIWPPKSSKTKEESTDDK